MALTFAGAHRPAFPYWLATLALLRAAAGLVACGLRHFGRPACIERRTGRVRPA
jgi:hypothetical protein